MKFDLIQLTTKTGLVVEFASPVVEEAQLEIDYLKKVCGQTRFLLSEPEDVNYTVEGEEVYIASLEASSNALIINAYVDGKMVGNGSFSPVSNAKRLAHRASLGIALFQEYCNQGIGILLIQLLLEKAKEAGYEIMELDVFAKNERARHLYKKLGFVECGRVIDAAKYKDGSYDDEIKMQKRL